MPTLVSRPPPAPVIAQPPRPRHSAIAEPWKRTWFYCAPGESATFGWIVLLHVAGLCGLFFTSPPSLMVILGALGLLLLGGLGTTIAYHRALTHGGIKLHPIVEHTLIFFAMFNGSGRPGTWVANHRLHHATVDTFEDISSPKLGGFWWSHLRWLWQAGQAPESRYAPDLDRPAYRFWHRMQVPILALSFFGGLAFGWTAWLWLGPLRLLWALHAQCTINSFCHLGDPTARGGSSKNVAWLTPCLLFQGENWHRNHHEEPTDPRIGLSPAQIDLGWWSIVALRRVGLVRGIRAPRAPNPARTP